MDNWIGVAVWIVLGAAVGVAMKGLVRVPAAQRGHTAILAIFGAFGAVVGGMLGVGIFEFYDPKALSIGGMAGALFLSALLSWTYRWECRSPG